jgi:outer membrane protein assembly factor BamB
LTKVRSKTTATLIVLFLMFAMAFSLVALPAANAHTPAWEIPTYAHISAAPDPVGVDQTVSVYIWLTNVFYGNALTNTLRFHNYKLTITDPDGGTEVQVFDVVKDTTSNQHTTFIPDKVGVYTLTFDYPGQTYTYNQVNTPGLAAQWAAYENDTFLPSSASMHLTVQEEQLPAPIGGYPLPTEYWTRPIYGENTNWWEISSNWLGLGAPNYGGWMNTGQDALSGPVTWCQMFPGDAIGSQTAHVMWTTPMQSGGVVGGNNFDVQGQSFFDGSAYLIRYNNPIILAGKLYYTETVAFSNTGYRGATSGPTTCVDLRTGKVLWSRDDVPNLFFGLLVDIQTVNEHGVSPPLLIAQSSWSPSRSSYWLVYDGDTGDFLCNVTNIPGYEYALYGNPPANWRTGAGRAMGPDGEYLDYIFANAGDEESPDWRLGEWNATLLWLRRGAGAPTFNQNVWPLSLNSLTIDAGISNQSDPNCRYDWNISMPYLNTLALSGTPFTVVGAKYNDGILMFAGTYPCNGDNQLYSWVSSAPYTYFFINLNPDKGAIGSVLWQKTIQPPANNYTVVQGPVDWDARVIFQDLKQAQTWTAYDLDSGDYLWTGDPQAPLDYYGMTSQGTLPGACAYGHLYSSAYGGIVYCYDSRTGDLLWTYGNGGEGNSTDSGFNWPYGHIPTQLQAIGNDVVYTVTSAHTWPSPIYKGGMARAINATDGSEIWTISGVTMEFGMISYAMADGYNTWFNGYDNQIYVVGRGPSATTVTASPKVSTHGGNVIIEGTVMDISSGTTQDEQSARFPNGVPAMSDASMTDWMSYIYQQKPLPADATGVTVTLSVFDSNNNCYDIGTATTDADGFFYYTWTPTIPGDFKVIATFAGTKGYWPSHAETAFTVMQAPAATPAPTSQPASTADIYLLPATIGIIIAIAVATIVIVLMLRKR